MSDHVGSRFAALKHFDTMLNGFQHEVLMV
jgi:hypothetical protein